MHAPKPAPTWKLWLLRWMALYPTIYAISLLMGAAGFEPPLAARLLLTTGLGSLLMSYVLMPYATRRFAVWLSR